MSAFVMYFAQLAAAGLLGTETYTYTHSLTVLLTLLSSHAPAAGCGVSVLFECVVRRQQGTLAILCYTFVSALMYMNVRHALLEMFILLCVHGFL